MKEKLKCKVCGNTYDACLSCQTQQSFFAWRNAACSIEHAKYYLVLVDYVRKNITKSEAKEMLNNMFVNINISDLTSDNQKIVNEILSEEICETKTVSKKKK